MTNEILQFLENAEKPNANISPTLLYNEGWMLRIMLQEIKNQRIKHEDLLFPKANIDWYSEALIPSPFLPRTKRDNLSESRTHAGAVVGKFNIDKKGELVLKDSCDFFYITEAKMYNRLSQGTKNSAYYNQAARNIACMAKLIYDNKTIQINHFKKLAFYVLLPEEQIKNNLIFEIYMNKVNIKSLIKNRMSVYPADDTNKKEIFDWIDTNLTYFITKLDVKLIPWEDLVEKSTDKIKIFYEKCKHYNKEFQKDETLWWVK